MIYLIAIVTMLIAPPLGVALLALAFLLDFALWRVAAHGRNDRPKVARLEMNWPLVRVLCYVFVVYLVLNQIAHML